MSSLTERLEAHAQRHDEFYPPDEEQTQWASDLREAIEAVRERDELARQRGELAARVIELQAHIDSIRIGARAVVAHWDEFGPEHGFDEAIDVLRRQLGALAAKVIEPLEAMGGAPREADAQRMGEVGGSVCEGERLAFEAWMRGHCWTLCATWDGKQYRSDAEHCGWVDARAMVTRQLWAAWRDRAALAKASRAVNVASDSQPSEMT